MKEIESLLRWRNVELDRAQTTLAERATQSDRKQIALQVAQSALDDSHELIRARLSDDQVFSAEALVRLRDFSSVQDGELKRAASSLEDARRETSAARAAMLKHYEAVAVVERLQKRRRSRAQIEELRREQKQLDEQALQRPRTTHAQSSSTPLEDTDHGR